MAGIMRCSVAYSNKQNRNMLSVLKIQYPKHTINLFEKLNKNLLRYHLYNSTGLQIGFEILIVYIV